jgi:hypothetical protein
MKKPRAPRWRWVRVDMHTGWVVRDGRLVPPHLTLRRMDFMDVNIMFRGWDHNDSALFTPNVAAVVEVWNNAARCGEDAFGGITRVQFIEEYLKPAWEMDCEEHKAKAS